MVDLTDQARALLLVVTAVLLLGILFSWFEVSLFIYVATAYLGWSAYSGSMYGAGLADAVLKYVGKYLRY